MGGAVLPPCSLAWGGPVLEFAVSVVGYRSYGRGKGNLLQEDLCQHCASQEYCCQCQGPPCRPRA